MPDDPRQQPVQPDLGHDRALGKGSGKHRAGTGETDVARRRDTPTHGLLIAAMTGLGLPSGKV